MARFIYRMQSILDLKYKLEEQAKIELGIANANLVEEQNKLRDIMVRRAEYEKRAKELVEGSINIVEIRANKQAVDTMKSIMRQQMLEVQKAEKNVATARNKLNEFMQDRKAHEKLKEKAFEEFKMELLQEEGKEIDQLVSYTYHEKEEQ